MLASGDLRAAGNVRFAMKICMLTSSYPKYAGETTAPFIEEIAAGLVRRGHTVHVVAPWRRDLRRGPVERGVHLHFYRYSPVEVLNVWGYAESLRGDIGVRGRALAAAPLALGASLAALLRVLGDERQTMDRQPPRTSEAPSRPYPIIFRPASFVVRRPRPGLRPFGAEPRGTGPDSGRGSGRGSSFVVRPPSAVRRPSSFDLIHAHWVLPNGLPAALAARIADVPLIISLHGSDVFMAEQNPAFALLAAALLRAADGVTACSGDLAGRAARLGARPAALTVVPYGVDAGAFRPDPQAAADVRAELGLPPDAPLVLAIGRLVYKKGLSYLIDAFPAVLARHPRAVLVIAGYGDLRGELERQAHALGLNGSVRFPGQLARDRAARYIAAADVYAVPSIRDQRGNVDGLPNTLLEGMGAARPIVASRVAGIPDVIADGCHGLLVPERDPAALAAAVSRLLDDRELAQRLGAAARERIVRQLTWDATAARFERVYAQALAAGRRGAR
jgi:glycosyltransferase involved in cell wall biosynthesis